jgi:hypothetical protein
MLSDRQCGPVWNGSRRAAGVIHIILFVALFLNLSGTSFALGQKKYVESTPQAGGFTIVQNAQVSGIHVDSADFPGVIRAANDLRDDIRRVTGKTAEIRQQSTIGPNAIIIGTLGKSPTIDKLIRAGKIDVSGIKGKWESFLIQVVTNPAPGTANALVIAGSDKRGTIYGIYDLSEQVGVSPWYWWADVPVEPRSALFVKPGRYIQGEPAVKYRGIFLNDEAPALTGWAKEKFGGFNSRFYTRVFELLLRLKANYLWPAMWNSAFNEDDPLNPQLADEYGIVMGTSHHEPMLRAQQEWKRHGTGPWDYSKNSEALSSFWREGVRRNKDYESIVTLAMRGDGDEPMSDGANIALLEKIVTDQRKILSEEVNPDVTKVPQLWALYKEVTEYYEKGMRVPDDVTLLWCDDNWGNIRRLPTPEERKRSGGAGIYYHFDYVGGPRSYRWINTNTITKTWEQMSLAYEYGARRIWIVNVGDLKPMEYPIEFFMNLAWNPARWPKEKLGEFTRQWAEREFGPAHAEEIADIVSKYTKYNNRLKPEVATPNTFSLVDYQEADKVVEDFHAITKKSEAIYQSLPENKRDAFFELVLHPVKASDIVNEMYVTAGKNRLYALQGRASTNDLAARARELFKADADLGDYYNHTLAGGKWNHMMDQTHLGYTYWDNPPVNVMPPVQEIQLLPYADMGIDVEGSPNARPDGGPPRLPQFDVFSQQRHYIDVFNRGRVSFKYSVIADAPWVTLSQSQGEVEKEQRLWISVDWNSVPTGTTQSYVTITNENGRQARVKVIAFKPDVPTPDSLTGFIETEGHVSIEAEHYTNKVDAGSARWEKIPDYGRTLSSMTIFPMTAASATPPQNSPRLEYKMYLFHAGKVSVEAILAPSLNFVPGRGLRVGVSFDDEPPQILDLFAKEGNIVPSRIGQEGNLIWEKAVSDSARKVSSTHTLAEPGYHILKLWMVDPGVVLQKLVVDTGGAKPSYLGPPETYYKQ